LYETHLQKILLKSVWSHSTTANTYANTYHTHLPVIYGKQQCPASDMVIKGRNAFVL